MVKHPRQKQKQAQAPARNNTENKILDGEEAPIIDPRKPIAAFSTQQLYFDTSSQNVPASFSLRL
jgi:hypothetical protein